jgi:hypothetical protein
VAHADVMRSIELFAGEVAPIVRAGVARRAAGADLGAVAGDHSEQLAAIGSTSGT